jgi:glycosyltransferase involved in cell wall biosynthesis
MAPTARPPGRIVVVVPAWNERATIADVVRSVREATGFEVVVVDDGSTDGTAQCARAAGATVLRHPFNVGVGGAVGTGLAHAQRLGAGVVVQVDADGQHDPSAIGALVAAVVDGADLAIGSRFDAGYTMGWVRRTAIRRFARHVERRLRTAVPDPTSGFRAFGPRAIDALTPTFPTAYLSDTVEVLLHAADRGLVVRSVPVPMRVRQAGQASAGLWRSAGYALRIWWILLAHRLPAGRGEASWTA